jgi:hypothetical protein
MTWFATEKPAVFFPELRLGDVLLFEGYDDIAALGMFLERCPVYHSALWWGTLPNGSRCAIHNVSDLWWGNAARIAYGALNCGKPAPFIGKKNKRKKTEDVDVELAACLVEHWMCGSASRAAVGNAGQVHDAVLRLLVDGGVGPFDVDRYLEETFTPRPGGVKGRDRRTIRSVTALRYPGVSEEATSAAIRSVLVDVSVEVNDEGFPAAELVGSLPSLFARAGYSDLGAGRIQQLIRRVGPKRIYRGLEKLAEQRFGYHADAKGGRICAMYVDQVYACAHITLAFNDLVQGLEGYPRRFVTPRDLFDCESLEPVATLLLSPRETSTRVGGSTPRVRMSTPDTSLFPYDLRLDPAGDPPPSTFDGPPPGGGGSAKETP